MPLYANCTTNSAGLTQRCCNITSGFYGGPNACNKTGFNEFSTCVNSFRQANVSYANVTLNCDVAKKKTKSAAEPVFRLNKMYALGAVATLALSILTLA